MTLRIGSGLIEIPQSWADFKDIVALKSIGMQFVEDSISYIIFAVDQTLVYTTLIYTGTVPVGAGIDQTTNDANKSDFETNYKDGANQRLTNAVEVFFNALTVANGYTTTTSTNFAPIEGTTYNEQTSNAQRSVSSNDADDTSAGTGARTVRITYYDEDLNGPFVETVTLNGTTAVNTAASDICFVDRMDVMTVGSSLGNEGTITLHVSTGGSGGTVGSIAPGDNETNWVHRYVATTRILKVLNIYAHIKGLMGGGAHLRSATPTVANTPESTVAPILRVPPGAQANLEFPVPLVIPGPARVTLYARPDASNSLDWLAGFNYVEEDA